MATTATTESGGSLNRELFERTLRYVSSTESTQDASTRDAQDAVLDSLPPQELDPRDQVVPGVPRPQSQSDNRCSVLRCKRLALVAAKAQLKEGSSKFCRGRAPASCFFYRSRHPSEDA